MISNSLINMMNLSRQDMMSRLLEIDVTSNNIANINTTGFKRSRTNFQELLENNQLSGVYVPSTQIISTQGSIVTTGVSTDMAIDGMGYFGVSMPDGEVGYTRDGHFSLNANGVLVHSSGYEVIINGTLPADVEEINITGDGMIHARNGSDWVDVGKIRLYNFSNPSALKINGSNILLETELSGEAVEGEAGGEGFGQILPQSLENSNVNMADELTRLITLQRAFQVSSSVMQQTDQMISLAINMR